MLVAPVIVSVATPDVFTVAVPLITVPSLNVTVPVGTTVPEEGLTVAVNTTVRPAALPVLRAGLSDEIKSVAVATSTGGATTTILIGTEMLAAKLGAPPYTAVIGCVPGVRVLAGTFKVAEPVSVTVETPSVLVPSLNVTLPVGIKVFAATTAVRTRL